MKRARDLFIDGENQAKRRRGNDSRRDKRPESDTFDPILGFSNTDDGDVGTSGYYENTHESANVRYNSSGRGGGFARLEHARGDGGDSDSSNDVDSVRLDTDDSDGPDRDGPTEPQFEDEYEPAIAGGLNVDEESRVEYISVPNPQRDVAKKSLIRAIHEAGQRDIDDAKAHCKLCVFGLDSQTRIAGKSPLNETTLSNLNSIHKLYIKSCHLHSMIPFEQMAKFWNERAETARSLRVPESDFPTLQAWEIQLHYQYCRMDMQIESKKRTVHLLRSCLDTLDVNGLFAKRCVNGVVVGGTIISSKAAKTTLELIKILGHEEQMLTNMISQYKKHPVSTSILPNPRRDGLIADPRALATRR